MHGSHSNQRASRLAATYTFTLMIRPALLALVCFVGFASSSSKPEAFRADLSERLHDVFKKFDQKSVLCPSLALSRGCS